MSYYSDTDVERLEAGLSKIYLKSLNLQAQFCSREYITANAKEFAIHGLCRRVGVLVRCVDAIFQALPPNQGGLPARENVLDATIYLQAFVFNTFGALDNLAWLFACEKVPSGHPRLARQAINLNKADSPLRRLFSEHFRQFIEGYADWFKHQEDYRHALAHRVPLYIPPSTVRVEGLRHASLGEAMNNALEQGKFIDFERLVDLERTDGVFFPVMIHSFEDGARPVMFHYQVLADFDSIEDIAYQMLAELQR